MRVHMDWYKASGSDPIRMVRHDRSLLYCGSVIDARNDVPTTNDISEITCGLCHRKLLSIKRSAQRNYDDSGSGLINDLPA